MHYKTRVYNSRFVTKSHQNLGEDAKETDKGNFHGNGMEVCSEKCCFTFLWRICCLLTKGLLAEATDVTSLVAAAARFKLGRDTVLLKERSC